MGQIVRKIPDTLGRGLRGRLEADGYEFRDEPHAHWHASGQGNSVTWYRSGKLLVQGKHADDFSVLYLESAPGEEDEPADRPVGGARGAAAAARGRDAVTEPVCGSDEAGKGDYFGPLVVAAVCVRPEDVPVFRTLGVRDSKEMSDTEVLEAARRIEQGWPTQVEVVSIGPVKYNELHAKFGANLNRLLAWAHATAIGGVLSRHPCRKAVVDKFGGEHLVLSAVKKQGLEVELEQRVRAESHPAVAAASVLARARFLRDLRRLGDVAGTPLHKGAGSPVDDVARRLFREQGLEGLAKVAKMHFKTTLKAQGRSA